MYVFCYLCACVCTVVKQEIQADFGEENMIGQQRETICLVHNDSLDPVFILRCRKLNKRRGGSNRNTHLLAKGLSEHGRSV